MSANIEKHLFPNDIEIFYLSKDDLDVLYKEIFVEKLYEKHNITVEDGDCLLDVGANIGLFGVWAKSLGKKTKIYAFEPIPETCTVLQKNMDLHNIDATVYSMGLSKTSGTAEFTHYYRMAQGSTMYPLTQEEIHNYQKVLAKEYKKIVPKNIAAILSLLPGFLRLWLIKRMESYYLKSQKIQCQLKTISEIIAEHQLDRVALVKIDAEGSEVDILEGIAADDWGKIQQFVIEVHKKPDLEKICGMLSQHGFTVDTENNDLISLEGFEIFMVYGKRL